MIYKAFKVADYARPEDVLDGYWHLTGFRILQANRFVDASGEPVSLPDGPGKHTGGFLRSLMHEPLHIYWTDRKDARKQRLYRIQYYRDHSDLE